MVRLLGARLTRCLRVHGDRAPPTASLVVIDRVSPTAASAPVPHTHPGTDQPPITVRRRPLHDRPFSRRARRRPSSLAKWQINIPLPRASVTTERQSPLGWREIRHAAPISAAWPLH